MHLQFCCGLLLIKLTRYADTGCNRSKYSLNVYSLFISPVVLVWRMKWLGYSSFHRNLKQRQNNQKLDLIINGKRERQRKRTIISTTLIRQIRSKMVCNSNYLVCSLFCHKFVVSRHEPDWDSLLSDDRLEHLIVPFFLFEKLPQNSHKLDLKLIIFENIKKYLCFR